MEGHGAYNVSRLNINLLEQSQSYGTFSGGDGVELRLVSPRNGSQAVERSVKFKGLDDFKGQVRPLETRITIVMEGNGEYVPYIRHLRTTYRPIVNVPNEGSCARIGLVSTGSTYSKDRLYVGALDKTGPGELVIEETDGVHERLYVVEGGVTLHGKGSARSSLGKIIGKAWMHLDATRADTMKTFLGEDGRTYVTNWASANGSGVSAYFQSDYKPAGKNYVQFVNPPFINQNIVDPSRPYVDFGAPIEKYVEQLGPQNGLLRFPSNSKIREVFIVRQWSVEDDGVHYNSVIGHESDYPLHANGGSMTLFGAATSPAVKNGEIRINGVKSTWASWSGGDAYTGGWYDPHILNVSPTDPIKLNILGSDRYLEGRAGGCRIAEVLLFTEKLTDGERAQINDYLGEKWFKNYQAADFGAVVMDNGTTLTVPEGRTVRISRLTLKGKSLVKKGKGRLEVDVLAPKDAVIVAEDGDVMVNSRRIVVDDTKPASSPYLWLDASCAETLMVSNDTETGISYLTNWTDKAGGSISATLPIDHSDYLNHIPTVKSAQSPTGLPVVDFGSGNPTTVGNASWMWFTQRTSNAYEGYIVYRHTENFWANIFGTTDLGFIRNQAAITGLFLPTNYSTFTAQTAMWTRNGVAENPLGLMSGFNFRDFSVVSFAAGEKKNVTLLAKDRLGNMKEQGVGRMQIAELVLYDRVLTEKERFDTEAYLMKKWNAALHPAFTQKDVYEIGRDNDVVLPEDSNVVITNFHGGNGTFVKTGSGDVVITTSCASTNEAGSSFTINSGSLRVNFDYPVEPVFHFDAMAADSFDTYEENETTFVREWESVCPKGAKAQSKLLDKNWTLNISKIRAVTNPTLTTVTINGVDRPAVDFGSRHTADDAASTAASMDILPRTDCGKIVEAYCVFRDRTKNVWCWPFTSDDKHDYHRGWSGGDLFQNKYANEGLRNGVVYINGEVVPYNIVLPTLTPYFVAVYPTNETYISTICADRDVNVGGGIIMEQIAFKERQPEKRRQWLREKIMEKWFGEGVASLWTNKVDFILLENGSTLELVREYAFGNDVVTADSVSGNGAVSGIDSVLESVSVVSGGSLAIGNDVAFADGVTVETVIDASGTLGKITVDGKFSSEGAVEVFVDVENPDAVKTGSHPLVEFDSFDGDISNWTLDATAIGVRYTAVLAKRDSAVCVNVNPAATVIFIR